MKVLCISDSHFGKKKWGSQPVDKLKANIRFSQENEIDVFYFGGDLAEPGDPSYPLYYWDEGLFYLQQIEAKHKVFVCGNNDIELIANAYKSITPDNYAQVIKDSFLHEGWNLLDFEDFTFKSGEKSFRFVGNSLFWDGSLWKDYDPSVNYEFVSTFYKEKWKRIMGSFSDTNFAELSDRLYKKIKSSVEQSEGGDESVIIATHTVPSKDCYSFPRENTVESQKSFYMGRNIEDLFLSKSVVAGFCSHTHSDDSVMIHGKPVVNISSKKEIQLFEF